MLPSDAGADTARPGDNPGRRIDAVDLFEQMLEAEIMGSGTYGADPDLDLIEERLSQLRQGPATAEQELPIEVAPALALSPFDGGALEDTAAALPPLDPQRPMRPVAPEVIVADPRPSPAARRTTSADAVVLEAARAAGVAPAYRQPVARPQRQEATPGKRRKRRASLPSFYLMVLALLLLSFALFTVWRPTPDEVIELPGELAGNVAVVVPAIPSLPSVDAEATPPLDPQITASVSKMPASASAALAATSSREGHATRRIVKLYRVDAEGNIIGLPPTP